MTGFPWGLLTLILLVLHLLLIGIVLISKPVIKRQCRRALARGNYQEVANLLHYAENRHLLKHAEYMAWRKEFGWHPDSDHNNREEAAERVHYLNGGK
jgi:hypothetical protein